MGLDKLCGYKKKKLTEWDSLAAYALQQLGISNATDIIGGYKAWRESGLPYDGPEVT